MFYQVTNLIINFILLIDDPVVVKVQVFAIGIFGIDEAEMVISLYMKIILHIVSIEL